jgi:hypothetical protein
MHEMVPGLVNNYYPAPRKSVVQPLSPAKLQTLPRQTIYLHNLGIATSKLFDQKFEAFLLDLTLKESNIKKGS